MINFMREILLFILIEAMDIQFKVSVEELVAKGARKEGFLLRKQLFISNKFLSKIVKIKKCKYICLLL